uniref:NADH-ubiquinone oxidoreductase chain 2 n=1 Tax=Metacrangonyx sp. 1 MDMBR-2012 TaxID=1200660 RepID=K7ZWL3_9CRUS|nr:NADH dehydrogenase subunit 2 [Metacrangonyx sp. 1 MDMBR-2012]
MFFHPSSNFFFFLLMFSLLMMISMSSWFMIWFFIEMNLLSFIPLILIKKNKYNVECSLKYFFIQTFSSILILVGLMMMFMGLEMYNYFFISGLAIKLGLAPFHQWLINIMESLDWPLIMILLSIQKVGPFVLLGYIYSMKESLIYILYLISLLCAFFGCFGGLFSSSLQKIMGFSSISHSSWMLLGLIKTLNLWIFYFFFYVIILFSILYIFNSFNIKSLNHVFMKLNFFTSLVLGVSFLSMGGLPPLTGFVPKFIFMYEFFVYYNYFTMIFLLFSVFISLFFYSRLFIFNFLFQMSKNSFMKFNNKKISLVLYTNTAGFILIPLLICLY